MSKQYDDFWQFHNEDNMDKHTVKLIKWQADQIKELEATCGHQAISINELEAENENWKQRYVEAVKDE